MTDVGATMLSEAGRGCFVFLPGHCGLLTLQRHCQVKWWILQELFSIQIIKLGYGGYTPICLCTNTEYCKEVFQIQETLLLEVNILHDTRLYHEQHWSDINTSSVDLGEKDLLAKVRFKAKENNVVSDKHSTQRCFNVIVEYYTYSYLNFKKKVPYYRFSPKHLSKC